MDSETKEKIAQMRADLEMMTARVNALQLELEMATDGDDEIKPELGIRPGPGVKVGRSGNMYVVGLGHVNDTEMGKREQDGSVSRSIEIDEKGRQQLYKFGSGGYEVTLDELKDKGGAFLVKMKCNVDGLEADSIAYYTPEEDSDSGSGDDSGSGGDSSGYYDEYPQDGDWRWARVEWNTTSLKFEQYKEFWDAATRTWDEEEPPIEIVGTETHASQHV